MLSMMAKLRVLFSVASLLVMVGACGASDETSSSEGTTTTARPESDLVECVASLVPGSSAVACEGVVYDLGIPEECFATPCGLIVDFHGSGQSGEQTDAYTDMMALGNAAGYVVVQPNTQYQSLDSTGAITAGRDRVFFDALIGALDIDVSRVHVGGSSAGGRQTWRFVCDHADLIASAAPLASANEACAFDENHSPAEQVDILMLQGRKDPTVSLERTVMPLLELIIESWSMTASEVLADEPTYQWTRWTNEEGTVLEFVEFDWTNPGGNGHCYPGGVGTYGCGIDTPIHYGEAALDFYIAHPKDV